MSSGIASSGRLEARARKVIKELLSRYSPSGGEERVAKVVARWARLFGCRVRIDEVGNVLAWMGPPTMRPEVALVSHMDTVPGVIPVKEDGWVIHGRGAVDAKGPLAAMLLSLWLLRARAGSGSVMLAALVDEEGGSKGAKHLISSGFRAKYVIVGEPTRHGIAVSYRGSLRLKVRCKGAGGHSSAPWVGDSALDKLLDGLCALRQATGKSYDRPTYTPVRVRAEGSGSKLPEEAEAIVDVRFPWGCRAEELVAFVESAFKGCDVSCEAMTEPVKVKPQDPVPRALARALISLGVKPRLVHKTGTSDMNLLWRCAESIAAYGPGDSRLAHMSTEFIDVRDVVLAAVVYARCVAWLVGSSRLGAPTRDA